MANELKYGDKIYLQNAFNDYKGGYLDTNGHADASGAKYGVSTAESPTRGQGTGTWEILSAGGKAVGTPVISGDLVQLRNLYGGDGGYLDTNGHAAAAQKQSGAQYDVLTSTARERAAGSGTGNWHIFARASAPSDRSVRIGDVVHLWNTYAGNGGFLETNGNGHVAGQYKVCTNVYYNRAADVADWKIHRA
ncbi:MULTISPECIES: hypothetical protein [unclassified Streptomyces]|uniref:hypothetical protein n=1 Tax=Streptomyces TaxID=1883 RepID=UPI0001C1BB7F|nr:MULTISPECIES: hypothetical protein [unclassified Streptomyces]AEN14259.1 conserved hypothetical protein [Streptomyces sp. SirexAA-E]MYR66724.1 hypothetical protein [Streptomyces sp. SID4939]MYS03532.1 hypothetical protein [Streptomyces sp. SID4940]MYT65936.1 hypothetical protein [Streptomyces sp. SID8357]MYT85550.1 hypothetical protein [Streptomyces sp. SID8360]